MNITRIRQIVQQHVPAPVRNLLSTLRSLQCRLEARYTVPRRLRYYASADYDRVRAERLETLRNKERISVVFPIYALAKWKADSLLRLMQAHPRFEPVIRYMSFNGKEEGAQEERARIEAYAAELGVPCVEFPSYEVLPAGIAADVVFVPEAYDGAIWFASANRGIMDRGICYIPYGFFSIGNNLTMNQIGNNAALFNLYENELSYNLAAKTMLNKARNVRIVGHTMADAFLNPQARSTPAWKHVGRPMKKVIWAPHWTITGVNNWFASGNFMQLAEAMVRIAQRHAGEIQFAFKPHPGLYGTLCKHPEWGKEKTDAYYKLWADMPNTQAETGAYAALFMQSDAMVHDSSSFIIEYMFADKPALFLRRGEGYQGYTPMAFEALNCYHKGITEEEIEHFLQQCVLGTEDPYAAVRGEFRRRYLIPPHGVSAAQNVIDCLLNQGAYRE